MSGQDGPQRGRSRIVVLCACPKKSLVGYGCGRRRHLGRGVACGGDWRKEWCVQNCTLRFSERFYERNNYELGGANWEYSCAPPNIAALRGLLHRLRSFLAAEARVVFGLELDSAFKVLCPQSARGWPRTTPSFSHGCMENRSNIERCSDLWAWNIVVLPPRWPVLFSSW